MTAADLFDLVAMPYAGDATDLAGPRSAAWAAVPGVEAELQPTPLDVQPSIYVQRAWAGRPYGATKSVHVRAAVAGDALHIRLEWEAPEPVRRITDNNVFPDACAVLFPLDGRAAELATMGSDEQPVQAWHWRAGASETYAIVAHGLGTVERQRDHGVSSVSEWKDGAWAVVFRRPLAAPGVPLTSGAVPLGCAIWAGASAERGGLKAHTPQWLRLRID